MFQVGKISIEDINLKDKSFLISPTSSAKKIAKSIQKVGLINLPILKEESGKYKIVAGFKRIFALKILKQKITYAKIIDANNLDALKIAICSNSYNRQLNIIEKSNAVLKLSDFLNEEEILQADIKFKLNLELSPKLIKDIITFSKLDKSIKRAVAKDKIAFNNAVKLAKMQEDERCALAKVLCLFPTTFSKEKEIIQHILEISKINKTKISEIIKEAKNDNAQENLNTLRDWLKKKRYPNMYNYLKNLEEDIKKIKLNHNVKIFPNKHLEKEGLNISFSFKNIKELEKALEEIKKIKETKILNQ